MARNKHQSRPGSPLTTQEVKAILTRFLRGDVNGSEARGFVKRVKDDPGVAVPVLLDRLRSGPIGEQELASYLLIEIGGPLTKERLLEITHDASATAGTKAMALATLSELGEPVDFGTVVDGIGDPEKFFREMTGEILSAVGPDETHVETFVREMETLPVDDGVSFIEALGHTGNPKTLGLLLPLLYVRQSRLVIAAIEALEYLGASEAVPALTQMSQLSSRPEVRARSRSAYGKIAVEALSQKKGEAPHYPPPQELPLFKALVSTVDGDGCQTILAARRRPNGTLKAVGILFNDYQGIKDCFGADMMTRREWTDIMTRLSNEGISWVDIGLPQCRRLLGEARSINVRTHRRLPVELEVWGAVLRDGPEAVRLWKDEEEDIVAGGVVDQELLWRTHELLACPEFGSWGFDADVLEPLVPFVSDALKRSRAPRDKKADVLEYAIMGMVKKMVTPRFRRLLEGRLRRQAWLLQKMGKSRQSKLAMVAAAALSKKSNIALEEQPFLGAMMLRSILPLSPVFERILREPANETQKVSGGKRRKTG